MTGDNIGRKTAEPGPRWRGPVWWVLSGLFVVVLVTMAWPLLVRPHEPPPVHQCLANVKNLAIALNMYLADYNAPPDPRRWCDQLLDYVKNKDVYRCPEARGSEYGYALNTGVGNVNRDAARHYGPAGDVVSIFESDRGWNAHGGRELLPAQPRHLDGDNYGFLDGHAKWFEREGADKLRWKLETTVQAGKE